METQELTAFINALACRLDAQSLKRLLALLEAIENGWGSVQFTVKNGQIVSYKLEKTG